MFSFLDNHSAAAFCVGHKDKFWLYQLVAVGCTLWFGSSGVFYTTCGWIKGVFSKLISSVITDVITRWFQVANTDIFPVFVVWALKFWACVLRVISTKVSTSWFQVCAVCTVEMYQVCHVDFVVWPLISFPETWCAYDLYWALQGPLCLSAERYYQRGNSYNKS